MTRVVQYNGVTHNFPDGTTDDQVRAALSTYTPAIRTQPATVAKPKPPTPQQLAYQDAMKLPAGGTFSSSVADGATLGANRFIDAGLIAGMTGVQNMITRAQGGTPKYGMADAFQAYRQAAHDQAEAHPVMTGVGGLLGGGFIPGLSKGAEMVNGALQGIKNPITRALASAMAGGATGAPLGAVNGALTAAPGQEMQGAQNGAMVGAVTGGLAPGAAYVGGKVVQGGVNAAKTIARATNKATGGQLLDPTRVAAQRLMESLKSETDPATLRAAMNEWMKNGVSPAFLDLLPQGGRTQALIRGSAMSGGGRAVAKEYANKVAADTQDNALALTRKLTPTNKQTAAQHQDTLEDVRGTAAQSDYLKPYAEQVPVSPVIPAITGPEGERAIATAYLNASANKLTPEIAARMPELQALQNPKLPETVSVGSLDQLKIALQRHAAELAANEQGLRAKGYGDLANLIDEHLAGPNGSPDYAIARDNYAANSRPIDAVQLGAKAMQPSVNPADYAASLQALGKNALPSAQVGLRSDLEQRIGAPTEGATGFLNRVATGTNPTQILGSTFGPEAAATYQRGIGNVVNKLQNARFIDQSSGSQTAGRLADLVAASPLHEPPRSLTGLAFSAINKLRQNATLTDAEKAAIAHIATSDAQSVLPTISQTTSTPAMVDDWLTRHLSSVATQGGLLGSAAFSNQSSQ